MKLYKHYDESLALIEQLDFKYQKVAAFVEYMVELRRIMREDSADCIMAKKHRISIENMQQ